MVYYIKKTLYVQLSFHSGFSHELLMSLFICDKAHNHVFSQTFCLNIHGLYNIHIECHSFANKLTRWVLNGQFLTSKPFNILTICALSDINYI